MKQKYIIGICSVGKKYHKRTKTLIEQIHNIIEIDILILTDEPSYFFGTKNVIIKQYEYKTASFHQELFSFHDKRLIFEEGFKYANSVLLLDSDHCIREQNKHFLTEFDSDQIPYGAYPQIIWKFPADCSIECFFEGKTPRVPYGKQFKEYCTSKNYKTENSFLMQESFLFIKESSEKISNFLAVWKDLQNFCELKDIERGQHVLGYGEGYSIGVALNHSNIEIVEGNASINKLSGSFKHLAWEKE